MRWLLFLLLSLILSKNTLLAQELVIESIGEKYNLNRKEVYRTLIDQKGYLWITACPGVFRFDGEKFEEIGKETTLNHSTCYNITEDGEGRIWLLNDERKVFKVENETVTFVTQLEFRENTPSTVFSFRVINNHLVVSTGWREIVINCHSFETTSKVHKTNDEYQLIIDKSEYDSNRTYKFCYLKSLNELNNKSEANLTISNTIDSTKKTLKVNIRHKNKTKFSLVFIKKLIDGTIGICWHQDLILIEKSGRIKKITVPTKGLINTVFRDSKGRTWVATKYDKLYCFDKEYNPINLDLHQFDGDIVTSMVEDDFGGIWFATYLNGLKYCQNIEFKKHELGKGKVNYELSNFCKVDENNVLVGQNNGVLYQLNSKSEVHSFFKFPFDSKAYIKSISFDSISNNIWCGTDYGLSKINYQNKTFNYYYKYRNLFAYDAIVESDSTLIIAGTSNVYKQNLNKDFDSKRKLNPRKKLKSNTLERGSQNEYWVGTMKGLLLFNGEKIIKTFFDNDTLNSRIDKIVKVNDTYWIVTSKHGLVSSKNGKLTIYHSKYGITDSRINCIYNAGDTNLWVGGDASLYRIELNSNPLRIERFDQTYGIPQGEIRDISTTENLLWLNIGKSIFSIGLDHLKANKNGGQTHITKLVTNDSIYRYPQVVSMGYDDKMSLNVFYNHLNYRRKDKALYRYRIHNYSKRWIETRNSDVLITGLLPGEYRFELQSLSHTNQWNPSEFVTIVIAPRYWQSLWFKVCCMVLFVVVVYLFVVWRIKKIQNKESVATQIAQLELKALKAQINPHFIFNSISSVQFYLSKNKPEKAAEYMQDYADLIRKVLDQSDNNLVSLDSEIKVLENYVKLESRKFKNDDLELTINVERNIQLKSYQIPPTLIQPFVENAIWHGLKNKEGEKKIQLGFVLKGSKLEITISDNGIGRDKAKLYQKDKKRKSYGMTITSNRISVLNNSKEDTFWIQDVKEGDEVVGTQVTLQLPYVKQERVY